MTIKLTEALRRAIRDEYVHGYTDENGVGGYPTVDALAKRRDIPRVRALGRGPIYLYLSPC